MAVPFYVPDEERENGSSSQPQSTTTSATQTPLQSPTNEHLVQVFYEALSLYSASLVLRSPCSTSPPSSPSCCHPHINNYRGNVFFPRPHVAPQTPVSFGRSHQWSTPRNEMPRRRLNSTGEEEDDEDIDSDIGIDECPSATSSSSNSSNSTPASPLPVDFNFEEHYTYLAARERLQEFPGQVPQKKKKVVSEEKAEAVAVKTQKKPKSKEQRFVWTTVVTAAVLAVGYISSR
ncbi:uncharacterized protein LOC119077191 [Bradysia coprophila]|uniref:uncharacterized protein LOC119077191 n=1 Tax=Bradysia coprophila TaxID=38358 RepID=UPI00187DA21D|nr:uncharacterized protein LOC119077191 [Bradysia coprophila]